MALELLNATPYACERFALTARNGATVLRIVLKGSFDIKKGGLLATSAEQSPVVLEDEFWGDPNTSSVRFESDVHLAKPAADLLLHGDACAPWERPAKRVDVTLAYQGKPVNMITVMGDREWRQGVLGLVPTATKPFVRMPVIFERAFGGTDSDGSYERNRCGTGYRSRGQRLMGVMLPNIERPDCLVSGPDDRPAPAGFGVVSRHWVPRMGYAGTYDQRWLDDRFPLLPDDFDERYFMSALKEQWIEPPSGGEVIRVDGMHPLGSIEVRLPPCVIALRLRYAMGDVDLAMRPETILLDLRAGRCILTWSADADIHGDPFRLRHICIGTPGPMQMSCCAG